MVAKNTKIIDVYQKYQQQAVDFSRRNRLLKYPARATRIDFALNIDDCEGNFGLIEDLAVSFPHKKILEAEKWLDTPEEKRKGKIPIDTQTNIIGQKLINTLEKLRLQSKKNYDEHGLHTLFLAIGEVSWKDDVGKGSGDTTIVNDFICPILLVPVSLESEREPYKATQMVVNTDLHPVMVNPVLLLYLKLKLGLRVPAFAEEAVLSYDDVRKLLVKFKKILSEKGIEANSSEVVSLRQYTFHGQQIYQDLKDHEQEFIKHDFIGSICGGEPFEQNTSAIREIDENYNTDDFLCAEEDYSILDADESQIRTIKKVLTGQHLVVHGPPGTGKSQTIANIISNLLARKKKILFVCEKQVALDVVFKRMGRSDLSPSVADLCLPLFKYALNKKTFAADIIKSRDGVIRESKKGGNASALEAIDKRKKRIDSLRKYASILTTPTSTLGKSPYWVFGQLSKVPAVVHGFTFPWSGKPANTYTLEEFNNRREVVADLNPYLDLLEAKNHIWDGVKRKYFTPDFCDRAILSINEIRSHVSANPLGDFLPRSISDLSQLLDIVKDNREKLLDANFRVDTSDIERLRDLWSRLKKCADLAVQYAGVTGYSDYTTAKWSNTHQQVNLFDPNSRLDQLLSTTNKNLVSFLRNDLLSLEEKWTSRYGEINITELHAREALFHINQSSSPLLSRSKLELLDIRSRLKILQNLSLQIEKNRAVIDEYGVATDSLNKSDVFLIEQRFLGGYKTFFRYFSSNYRSDRDHVSSWCNLRKPDGYKDARKIVESSALQIRLDEQYSTSWEKLLSKYSLSQEITKLPLEYILRDINAIIDYLELCALDILRPEVQQDLSNAEKRVEFNELSQDVQRTQAAQNKIPFLASSVQQDGSLVCAVQYWRSVVQEFESLDESFEKVKTTLVSSVKLKEGYAVNDLLFSIGSLNALKTIHDQAATLETAGLFSGELEDLLKNDSFSLALEHVTIFNAFAEKLDHRLPNPEDVYRSVEFLADHHGDITGWLQEYIKKTEELSRLCENSELYNIHATKKWTEYSGFLNALAQDKSGLERWTQYQQRRSTAEDLELNWFLDECGLAGVKGVDISELFVWSFLNNWVEQVSNDNAVLRGFTVEKYQKMIEEFKELELQSFELNQSRILSLYANRLTKTKLDRSTSERVLSREAEKQRRHLPIRKVVQDHAAHIQEIKPCWMVSPLLLGSYLDYKAVDFDVVIFDEASQMKIENSLGAIARSKQVIVIGDPHQLPPTSFFDLALEGDDSEEVEEETGFESILQRAISLLSGSDSYLKYHYRSSSEDLIAFSNHYIYSEHPLVTFPNPSKDHRGVFFEFVSDGIYDAGGTRTNQAEATRVANLCLSEFEKNPNKSMGVIAFSRAQEDEIRRTLQEMLKEHPLGEKFDEAAEGKDAFFIKNLESVQGDERDTIILSVCYGPDKHGSIYSRFGPINSATGYRRLNVAVTRAKDKLFCVSSMRGSDTRLAPPAGSRGANLLKKYLEYAERGIESLDASQLVVENNGIDVDSDFELSVERALQQRGFQLHRQVGASGFKIDLAVVDPANMGNYILGIECDGATYHSSMSARTRDRIRQDILERLGWKIYRVWSQHWYTNSESIVDDIVRHIYERK